MEVRELGEFQLIEHLARMVAKAGVGSSPREAEFPLLVGIGDDAAAWRTSGGVELSTTDTMVEGVHFTRSTTPWDDLGWKVMAANLSDIAAMGGQPLYALVTLGLPENTPVSSVETMYQGMIEACQKHSASIAGGDVVRSPIFFVSVTLNGIHEGIPMLRSAARPENLLAVTGFLGSSRGGLEILMERASATPAATEYLRQAHRRPQPRLEEGRVLVEEGVLAAMDVSDGLVEDLSKFMLASGMTAELDSWKVPVHPLLQRAFPLQALSLALAGGEDYELLYAAPSPIMERTLSRVPRATIIGRVTTGSPGQVHVRDREGHQLQNLLPGWNHFRL